MTVEAPMSAGRFSLFSFPVVTGLLAALALGLVLLGFYWGLGRTAIFLLAVPIALAVVYLAWYSRLPYVPPHPTPGSGSSPDDAEPFEDPVEEADRLDATKEEPDDSEDIEPESLEPATEPPVPPDAD